MSLKRILLTAHDSPRSFSTLLAEGSNRIFMENGLLSCIEIDKSGNIFSGRYLKSALCNLHSLQPRDLRKLDGTLKNQLPTILVRPGSLLIHLDQIRAIVTHCSVTLFESGKIIEDLQHRLKSGDSPFEFVVLETMLARVVQALQEDYDALAPQIEDYLSILERQVHWDKLKLILECKKKITAMAQRANSFRDCLRELLESDSDMAHMYLTHKAAVQDDRPVAAHEEVEILLESYLKTLEEIAAKTSMLDQNIQSTEEIVNIGLIGQRNELLLLELKLSIGTFAASMGAFGASVLGMNLTNHLEASPAAFYIVLSSLIAIAGTSFGFAWRRMRLLLNKSIIK